MTQHGLVDALSRAKDGTPSYITPEAFVGGTIALIHEGDSITIDAPLRLIQLNVSDAELAKRRASWRQPAPRYTRGVLAKYARLVSSASTGAVTD